MPVCSKGLAIYPSLRNSVICLRFGETKKTGDYGCGSNFDKNDMVKTNTVETVF
jgi:hypothetical protein